MLFIENLIEIIFGLGLFLNALLFIPQLIKVWRTKKTKDISLITFAGFNLLQLLTIIHAYLHKDYILLIGMSLALLISGCVTLLVIVYRLYEQ